MEPRVTRVFVVEPLGASGVVWSATRSRLAPVAHAEAKGNDLVEPSSVGSRQVILGYRLLSTMTLAN